MSHDDAGLVDDVAAPVDVSASAKGSGPRVNLMLIAAVGLFLGVVLGAVLLRVAHGSGGGGQSVVQAQKPGLPVRGNGPVDPAVGLVAPDITGQGLDGTTVSVTADGRPRAIVFLAHWCPNCQREVPQFVDLANQGALSGVDVVGVVTGTSPDRPNYPPSAWLQREHWPFRTVLDRADGATAQSFGVDRVPVVVFVDAHGRIAARLTGASTGAAIAPMLAALAAGTPISVPAGGATSPR